MEERQQPGGLTGGGGGEGSEGVPQASQQGGDTRTPPLITLQRHSALPGYVGY